MIYQKLAEIQNELFVPKEQTNDFGKYNYRSCEDILKVAKPLCRSKGCVLHIINDLVRIGERNYVEAKVILIDLETGEQLSSLAHAREDESKKGMDGAQITGAASSYARKYALAGLFCIDNEEDSDTTNDLSNEVVNESEIKTIKSIIKTNEIDERRVLSTYKVEKIEDMTHENFSNFMAIVGQRKEAKKCNSQESSKE